MSCSGCWVKTRGLCDLCSSPPRCLKDSETPACVGVYISLMMEREKKSSELLYFFVFPFFCFLSLRKFHTEDCSAALRSILPLFSRWLMSSSSAVNHTEQLLQGNAEGTWRWAHYTLLSIEQKRSHSHNIFCITGNFLEFPVINLANSIFCGLIHLASQQRFQQIWQLPVKLFSLPPLSLLGFLSTKSHRTGILIQQVSSEIIFSGKT